MNPIAKAFNDLLIQGFEYFGRYYSSYRGFVVDNEDPDSYGRIKVKVPQVYGSQTMDYWAWQKNNFSGVGYGSQCIPQIGDMIFVEFESGDPKKPIWSYGHFGKTNDVKDKPTELSKVDNYWFKTPKGNLIEFDDGEKSIRITGTDGTTVIFKEGILELNGKEEPSVLGSKNEEVLNLLYETLGIFNGYLEDIVKQDTAPVKALTSALGVTLTYDTLAAIAFPKITAKLKDIKTKIPNTKSEKVKLS